MKRALVTTGLGLLLAAQATVAQDLAVRAERLYPVAGPAIDNGVVLIRNGRIERVGPADRVRIPDGVQTLEARVVTPGLIDARSVVGLAGYLNQPHDQDQLESSAPIQPQLRAIDAYNPRETLVGWLREHGITTVHTGHGTGALVSGQTLIAKTWGNSAEAATLQSPAMIAAQLGSGAFGAEGKSPGNRSKQVAMLRAQLVKAGEYRDKLARAKADSAPPRDLELEVLVEVLDRKRPLLVTAWREQDILSALRLAQEFNFRLVLDGAAEAYLVVDQIKAAGVPVLLHPTMARQYGELENASFTTAAALHQAGIPFALQSGYEGYVPKTRVVLWEAAIAAANGLGFDAALASISLDAARILGIEDRVGSLEAGKDGDLVLFDGDPFEYTSHVTAVVINGQVVSTVPR
ncbi:amidohydrolase family protein [Pseudofulvimonas gallinarii]|jgi:imidazolonepropionase-like amidohydrolase|uniref:Imidazolonepropionase-like amidohydrolase n=1 Tax=Pseudofulvimonas gallinarii TaxID=634155 RepID=A0A4V3UU64_9GAMM|nr:amidohydrolase family protein [Pseudofulvimonas gallinarii]TCS96006.1 imidazolonepropionase-like amidohydrolase [Pseudofulvimonas gallinarii]THD13321.1 amidohydrolase [Pseudofulvimonas gallinarii]